MSLCAVTNGKTAIDLSYWMVKSLLMIICLFKVLTAATARNTWNMKRIHHKSFWQWKTHLAVSFLFVCFLCNSSSISWYRWELIDLNIDVLDLWRKCLVTISVKKNAVELIDWQNKRVVEIGLIYFYSIYIFASGMEFSRFYDGNKVIYFYVL